MSHTPEHQENPTAQPIKSDAPAQHNPQVQYIVTEQSLEGIGGWLMFWMVMFSIAGITQIILFFSIIDFGISSASSVSSLISSPLLAVGFILSTVLIALRQKLGQTIAIATIALAGFSGALNTILSMNSIGNSLAITAGGVLASLVVSGLVILYFVLSKRVQKTLTR